MTGFGLGHSRRSFWLGWFYDIGSNGGTSMARHNHEHCEHEEVAYCGHCQVVHCKDCKREWSDCKLSHWPYTYIYPQTYTSPVITGTTYGDSITLTGDNHTAANTDYTACSHGY